MLNFLELNHTILNQKLDVDDYDVGHILKLDDLNQGKTIPDGICSSEKKAKGLTTTPNPIDDYFVFNILLHELGHQLGAHHTFSSYCAGTKFDSSSVEPASGSTIMSYAGICEPNIQDQVDAYFHNKSIQFIKNQYGE